MTNRSINGISVSPWMYDMAMGLSFNPGLALFDDINLFSRGSFVDQPEFEVDDYDEAPVCRAEVFQLILLDPQEQRLRRSVFRYFKACEVVSDKLVGDVLPSPYLIVVPDFPLTRDIVLDSVRRHVAQRTEYGQKNNQFLWGPEVVDIRNT